MSAIREPVYGPSRHRTDLPRRSGEVSESFVRTADELISASARLQPVERLELYHRQYWYRLLDSIEEDFPALKLLLGDEAFWALMEAYLETVPSTSFTLRHLGRSLAGFLREHPGSVRYPVHARELARLEYALMEAFEEVELPAVEPKRLAEERIRLQPHVKLMALRTEADEIWRRAQDDAQQGEIVEAAPGPVRWVAACRLSGQLRVETLDREEFEVLRAIERTHRLEDALEAVTDTGTLDPVRDADRVGRWFARWAGMGWLASHETDEDRPRTARRQT